MMRLAALLGLVMFPVLLAAQPAQAQIIGRDMERGEEAAPPPSAAAKLDTLFARLAEAEDAASAKEIAKAIWQAWLESGSDTVDLLVLRATSAMEKEDYDVALHLLDAVVALEPNFAEGWNKRATVYYFRRDYDKSISDIGHVLALEPRHFGAMAGLGAMLKEIGRSDAALEIYRRALKINPHLSGAKRAIEELSVEVEGRDI